MQRNDREIALDSGSAHKDRDRRGKLRLHRSPMRYVLRKTGRYPRERFLRGCYTFSDDIPLSPACALFRREYVSISDAIPNHVGYDHRKTGAGPDIRIFLNALVDTDQFCYIKKPLAYYRGHVGSISYFDKTIRKGYLTAKLDYLDRYFPKQREWRRYLNAEMLLRTNAAALPAAPPDPADSKRILRRDGLPESWHIYQSAVSCRYDYAA